MPEGPSIVILKEEVHSFEGKNDSALDGNTTAHVAMARAPGCDGNSVSVGESENG